MSVEQRMALVNQWLVEEKEDAVGTETDKAVVETLRQVVARPITLGEMNEAERAEVIGCAVHVVGMFGGRGDDGWYMGANADNEPVVMVVSTGRFSSGLEVRTPDSYAVQVLLDAPAITLPDDFPLRTSVTDMKQNDDPFTDLPELD